MDIMIVMVPSINGLVRLLGFTLDRSGKLVGIMILILPGTGTMLASTAAGIHRLAVWFVYPIDSFFSTMFISTESKKARMAPAWTWEYTRELLQ